MQLQHDTIAAAFTEWDRRYREEPDRFESGFARVVRGQTTDDYGQAAAAYLQELVGDVAAPESDG